MATVSPPHPRDEREALVLAHRPLARRLARRYARVGAEREDLAQVADLGLVKAARSFDPERGTSFASFAVPTVLGELRRYCRDTRWAVHVPRPVQERVRSLRRFEDEHESSHGRGPTTREASEALGCSQEDILDAKVAAVALAPESLNATIEVDGGTIGEAIDTCGDDDPGFEATEMRDRLALALWSLSRPARQALWMRVHAGLTTQQIADRMRLTPSQAARLVATATRDARTALRDGEAAAQPAVRLAA